VSHPLLAFLPRVPTSLASLRNLALALSCTLLASCASTLALYECDDIVAQNSSTKSLLRLQQLVKVTPESGGCMKAYLLVGERVVATELRQADRLSQEGRSEEAAQLYRRVLELQPGNDQARQGLRTLERQQRHLGLLEQARRAVNSLDWESARVLVDGVLRADPENIQALALREELTRRSAAVVIPPTDSGLASAFRKPISLEFRDLPLRQIFEVLSRSSGLNFVFDKDVKADQKTSIFLRDSTVESALYFLLLTNQLEHQVMNGNTVLIYPNAPGKLKEYQELSVRTFQMANTDVKSVAATLRTLFKGRDVVVDEKLNMLVVRDTPDALRLVEKIVALHDVAEPEVMLEVAILEVSRKKLLNLGVDLPNSLSLTPLASNAATGLTLADLRALNSTSIGAPVGAVTLNLRKENTDVNILANPRIRVVNREKAKVLIGERVPIVTVTTSPTGGFAESISYVEVGLKLDVEPTIYRGNDIVIKVGLEVSNIAGSTLSKLGGVAYTFGTRTANTTLRLRDGENQILAGLINDEDRKVASKVPGLGDLPVAGRLFGTQQDDSNKTEIMLSITPRLVRNATRLDAATQEFRSGTESSLRERPGIVGKIQVPASPAGASTAAPIAGVSVAPVVVLPAASNAPIPSAPPPAPAPAPAGPARAPATSAVPAVLGMPTVNITSSPAGAALAGKATGTRSDEGFDAK
jgi:general secretion pathway protein D